MIRKRITAFFAGVSLLFATLSPLPQLTLASVAVLGLAGCSTFTTLFKADPAKALGLAASNAQILLAGLQGATQQLSAMPGISSPTLISINTALTDMIPVVNSLQKATTLNGAQPLVQQIVTDANAIIAAAALIPGLPPQIALPLDAAAVLLPVIAQAVELAVQQATPPTPTAALAMTPAEARAILLSTAINKH